MVRVAVILLLALSGCSVSFKAEPTKEPEISPVVSDGLLKLSEDTKKLAGAVLALDTRLKKLEPKKESKK